MLGMMLAPTPRDLDLAENKDAASFINIGGVSGDQLVNVCSMLPISKAKDLQCLLNTGLFPVNQTPCCVYSIRISANPPAPMPFGAL